MLGRAYRAFLLTLVVIAGLPGMTFWSSFLVRSDSMAPTISAGDVVVAQHFGAHETVPIGKVMIFQAPSAAGAGTTFRVHRVIGILKADRYTTKGDANATADAIPVPRASFRARAVILVPWVGLPLLWAQQGRPVRFAAWLLLSLVLIAFSFRSVTEQPVSPPRDPGQKNSGHRAGSLHRLGRPHRHPGPAAFRACPALFAASLLTFVPQAASAAFAARTTNGSDTWKAAGTLLQPYTAAVVADSPWAFYRLDESSGPNAYDSTANQRTGIYTNVSAYQASGALPDNPGYAVQFDGSFGRMVGGGSAWTDPTTFSIELWFKSTSSAGGKLVGFENSRNQTSTLFDRELILRTDGRLAYLGAASSTKVLVSPTALNNGLWHHVVITAIPNGANNETTAMYVDGILVASGNTSKAATIYGGWWRLGYGLVPVGTNFPATGNYTGSIDDFAIYNTQLSATRIGAHYAAR